MGALSIAPDQTASRQTGSRRTPEDPSERALALVEAGADIVGVDAIPRAPSTSPLTLSEEIDRVLAVVETVRKNTDAAIAVITREPTVALEAVTAGADIIDDEDGFADDTMRSVIVETGSIALLHHSRGSSTDRPDEARYEKVVLEVKAELGARIASLRQAGADDHRIWIDPGLGIAKNEHHDSELMRRLDEFHLFEKPIAIAANRNGLAHGCLDRQGRTSIDSVIATAVMAALQGAHILRVEEVAETVRAIRTINAIQIDPGC